MKQFQKGRFTVREHVFARLAREIGRTHDAIYHGTRFPQDVLRSGKLNPDHITHKISLSRSPVVAAYFALLPDDGVVRWSPAVLVFNRSSLIQTYRLEPWRDREDLHDEQEEVIWGRTVSFRRHLLGVVREADVARVLGTLERTYGEELREGDRFVRDGRARVRDLIVSERKQRGAENARMPAQTVARVTKETTRGRVEGALSRFGI